MKTAARSRFATATAILLGLPIFAQISFNNLDFEMAQNLPELIPANPVAFVSFTNALPYWQGMAGGVSNPDVVYASPLLDSPQIGLYGPAGLFS